MTRAVTELRRELNCSLKFILDTINSNDSLPHLAKSDYYYWSNRVDPDIKHSELMNASNIVVNSDGSITYDLGDQKGLKATKDQMIGAVANNEWLNDTEIQS